MPSSGCKKCARSEEHTSELQSHDNLVCRLLLEKKKNSTQDSAPPSTKAESHAIFSRCMLCTPTLPAQLCRLYVPALNVPRNGRTAQACPGKRTPSWSSMSCRPSLDWARP